VRFRQLQGESQVIHKPAASTSKTPEGLANLDAATSRRAELKAFLRARRAALAPEREGLSRGTRRLTPGLRREEVASLANVGLTWYTWLEQGRKINVSADTLRRVSRALRLSASDQVYLFTLAGLPPPPATRRPAGENLSIWQRVLDGFTSGPAVMFGPSFDVLAYNALWDVIYAFDGCHGPFAHNHVYRMFMDPRRLHLYADYDAVTHNMVGLLRAHYANHVGDPQFEQLVDELQRVSAAFARLWKDRQTQPLEMFALRLRHETLGRLALHVVRVPADTAPGALVFLGPPADAQSAAVLTKALWRVGRAAAGVARSRKKMR
jgi:transcriptional regulator with XRE-family HTH domain